MNYIAIIQNLIYKHKVLAHMLHVFFDSLNVIQKFINKEMV